jgi:glucan phosphorylase
LNGSLARPLLPIAAAIVLANCTDTPAQPYNEPLARRCAWRAALDLYVDREVWACKAILNAASSGKFFSDRTIAQYATEIWHAKPCPVA